MNRKIVIITAHYPFGYGETFLEDELKLIDRYFNEIIIISMGKSKIQSSKHIPKNAKVIKARKSRFEARSLFYASWNMLTPKTLKELNFSFKKLRFRYNLFDMLKSIFTYYYMQEVLNGVFEKIELREVDIVYSYWMVSAAYFTVWMKNRQKKNPPLCISRTHGGDCYIDKFYQPFRREILEFLDAVFPISNAGKESIEKYILPHLKQKKHAKLIVSRLGVIAPIKQQKSYAPIGAFHIATCSNVIQLKRLDLIIDALSAINNVQILWTHFGDGNLFIDIQNKAKDLLCKKENIKYNFMGRHPKQNIFDFYDKNSIDLFINASDSEGIPVSIMEVQAFGIPVIARDVGGNSEIIFDGVNGFLLPTTISADELKSAIMKFISLPIEEKQKLRNGAFKTFNEKYNAEKNYNDFFHKILNLSEENIFNRKLSQ